MTSKRVPLALALSAVLFVTAGFAATKKIQRHDGSRDRNDLSLQNDSSFQNGDLLNLGSSVSSGSFGFQSSGAPGSSGSSLILGSPGTPDNWNGGTGDWNSPNNKINWSTGLPPAPTDDVTIYSNGSKGNDLVTLNTGSTPINSLTLGGPDNGFTSELTDGGTPQTLTIKTFLNVGQQGTLSLTGGSTVSAGADSSNAGLIDLENASMLKVTGNFDNAGTMQTGAFHGGNTLTITGTLTNEASGLFYVFAGAATIGNLVNNGYFYVGTGASVNLTGQPGGITDVVAGSAFGISGTFTAGANSAFNGLQSIEGGLSLNNGQMTGITPGSGTLTIANTGNFRIGAIGGGSTANITGNVLNNGSLTAGALYTYVNGTTLNISGTLTNNGQFSVNGEGDIANVVTLVNNGSLYIDTGATLNLTTQLNVTDIAAGTAYGIGGTFNAGPNNAFASLASIEGSLGLGNGQTTNITPGSGTLTIANTGTFAIGEGSTVNITGNVTNGGNLTTAYYLGGNNTLNVSGTLTNEAGAKFYEDQQGGVAGIGNLVNNGYFYVGTGASVNLTGQPGGITDVVAGSQYDIHGGFTAGTNSALANLNSIEGSLSLVNGQTTNITPGSGTLTNSGTFDIGGGSTAVNIIGNVTNSYYLTMDYSNDTLNISGTLTNNNQFYLSGAGEAANVGTLTNSGAFYVFGLKDTATLGSLTNSAGGVVDVANGSTLTINGAVDNSGTLATNNFGGGGGNTLTITGTLTNEVGGQFILNGPGDEATIGSLTNAGTVNVDNGSTLTILGAVTNSGNITTGIFGGGGGGNTLNIGALTNMGGVLTLYGSGDMATIGGDLINLGGVNVDNGSTLQINGNASNDGQFTTGSNAGGNTVTILGDLTNGHPGHQITLFGDGDTFTVVGTPEGPYAFDNNGGFTQFNKSTATVDGLLFNEAGASIDLEGSGSVFHAAGGTLNSGAIFVANVSSFDSPGLDNSGTIDLENGSALTVNGNMNNSGSLYTSFYGGSGNNTITINGTLTNDPGSQFALLNATDKLIINGGMNLFSGAALSTPTLNNGGTINVDNLSTLLVGLGVLHGPTYNYTQLANGTLGEIINSYSSFGVINVNGSALLAGTLDILLKGGFNPAVGSEFKFFLANPGQINGTFASILLNGMYDTFNCTDKTCEYFAPDYEPADGYVELTVQERPVPEPATLLVLIPGLLGVGYGLRRRMSQ